MFEYFQDGSSQIAFLIGGSTEHKIKDWLSCAEDNGSIFKRLSSDITSMLGGYGLIFDFNFLDDTRICIRIQNGQHNLGFSSAFQASPISGVQELVENLPIRPNPYRISSDKIIFNVYPVIYEHIAAWKNWNIEMAFTSRYSYSFQHTNIGGIDNVSESIQVFDRATKSLCLIFINYEELYFTGELGINPTYSSEKLISQHVALLNSCIDRDYRMMQEYQQIKRFYPEYDQGIRIFFNELGIQSKYERYYD